MGTGAQSQPHRAPGEDLVPEPPHEEQEELAAAGRPAAEQQQLKHQQPEPPPPRVRPPRALAAPRGQSPRVGQRLAQAPSVTNAVSGGHGPAPFPRGQCVNYDMFYITNDECCCAKAK